MKRVNSEHKSQWRNLHPRCPRGAGVTQIGAKWNRRKIPIILKMTLCYSCVFARNACKTGTMFWCGWCGTAPLAGLSHQIAPFTKNRTTNKNSHHTTPLLQNRFKPHRHNKSWSHLIPLDPTLFLPLHVRSRDSARVMYSRVVAAADRWQIMRSNW